MIRFLSIAILGNDDGFEPVAIIDFVDSICSFVPSAFVMLITDLDSKLPTPVYTVILFFFIKKLIPSQVIFTTPRLRSIICLRFTFGALTSIPCSSK